MTTEYTHEELIIIIEKIRDYCKGCEHCNYLVKRPTCARIDSDLAEFILDNNPCPEGNW